MADTLSTTIASAAIAFKEKFQDNIFAKSALLTELWSNKRTTDGGSQVQIPVRWSKGSTVGTRAAKAQFTFAETDTVKSPALDWVYYQQTGEIGFENLNIASGKHQVLDLMKIELSRMERELHEYLASDVLSDGATDRTPNPGVTGLTAICGTTNTYAGFLRTDLAATHPWMGHTIADSSLVHSDLAGYIDTINVRGFKCNAIYTTPTVKTKMRFAWGVNVQRYNNMGGNQRYSLAMAPDFDFQGIPVYSDELCPAGYVYLLNTETLRFVVPTGSDPFQIETFSDEPEFKGVRLRVAPMLQLECLAPYHNYLITGVTSCATS